MKNQTDKPRRRRSIRLQQYDYSHAGAYYVTVCVRNRALLFGDVVSGQMEINRVGQIVQTVWNDLPQFYEGIELDQFIVMPNHVHGIVVIPAGVGAIHESPLQKDASVRIRDRRRLLLSKIIGRFKMVSAKNINLVRETSGVSVWQRNYYEHIIRDQATLNRIRQYIEDNPAQWEFDEENPAARTSVQTGDS